MAKVVFVPGVFDMFHHGHKNLMIKARQYGDKVIAGVITDQGVMYKNKVTEMSQEERINLVKESGLADEVIFTDSTVKDYRKIYEDNEVDVHLVGHDHIGTPKAVELEKDGKIQYTRRTEGISSTILRQQLKAGSDFNVGKAIWGSKQHEEKLITLISIGKNHSLDSIKDSVKTISLILQRNDSVEYIYIDDGKDSEKVEYVRKLMEKVPNSRVIKNDKEVGFTLSTEKTTKMARGKYYHLINPEDDISFDNFMEYTKYLSQNEFGLVINNYYRKGKLRRITNKIKNPRNRFNMFYGNVTFLTSVIKRTEWDKGSVIDIEFDKWLIINALQNSYDHILSRKSWYNHKGLNSSVRRTMSQLETYEDAVVEILKFEAPSRIKGAGKDRHARMIEHQQLRSLVGLTYFRSIIYDSSISKEVKYVKENIIDKNPVLSDSYKKDFYHNNLFKFTFSWPLRFLAPLIRKVIKAK